VTQDITDITHFPPTAPKPRRKRLFGIAKAVLLVLVFALVGYAVYRQWKLIDFSTVTIRPIPLLLSFVALVAVSTVQMISYRTLLGAYAHAPRWLDMLAVAWVPPLGKYVPGKVAALLAAMSMLRRFAIPMGVAVAVVLVLDGLAVIAGLITGAPLLFWEPVRRAAPWAWVVCIPVVVGGIVALYPAIFGRLINVALRKLKKEPLPRMPPVSEYLIPVACAFAQWVFAGLSLMWIVQAVTGDPHYAQLPLFISFAALSQTIGYLALFAPGGIGVREAILLAGLQPVVGPLVAIIVPIRAIAQIAVDLTLALLGLLLLRRRRRPSI